MSSIALSQLGYTLVLDLCNVFTGVLLAVMVGAAPLEIWNCQDDVCQVPPTGFIFAKEREITITGEVWTITSDININHFWKLHDSVTNALTDATQTI